MAYFLSTSVVFSAQHVQNYTYDVLSPFAFRDKQEQLTGIYIEIVKIAISMMPDLKEKLEGDICRVARRKRGGSSFNLLREELSQEYASDFF